jgi:transcription elongation GreA/GreB family factor
MSKAFTKESDEDGGGADLPERIVSPHPNLVTEKGLAAIDAEIERLSRAHDDALATEDRDAAARAARDLRYFTAQRNNAQLMPPPPDAETVHFGSTVKISREDGREETWRIVGEDEADPTHGTLSHVAPVARAMLGRRVGDEIRAGNSDAEIVSIS